MITAVELRAKALAAQVEAKTIKDILDEILNKCDQAAQNGKYRIVLDMGNSPDVLSAGPPLSQAIKENLKDLGFRVKFIPMFPSLTISW